MATTEIHAITSTPQKALKYVIADKIESYSSKEEINKDLPHILFEENGNKYVRYFTLVSCQNCEFDNPYSTMKFMQDKWQNVKYSNNGTKAKNNKEPLMWHLHQSFKGHEVTPEQANEIGQKLAKEIFAGFPVVVSTHCNRGNIHNHFMICAWGNDGKKWNNCNSNYKKIRTVSDRLCREYGLSVLEETTHQKLIRWKDKDGKTHYYEPTTRKSELIENRAKSETVKDDVGSYRHTAHYAEEADTKKTNREEVKRDIDAILPFCESYEELLMRLRELGYEVKDKKKNGEWLAHISFKAPLHEKATRENNIGDGRFYVRENLERYIVENSRNKTKNEKSFTHGEEEKDVVYFDNYEYGETPLEQISLNYKKVLDNGEYKTVERTETEKRVIADIHETDREIKGLIDTSHLHKLIAEQKKNARSNQPHISKTKGQELVNQINNSFRCLKYIEQHSIISYEQAIALYSANKEKYDTTIEAFAKIDKILSELKEVLIIPEKLKMLQDKIDNRRNNIDYILEDYSQDNRTAEQYKALLLKYKIHTPQGLNSLQEKVADFERRQEANKGYLSKVVNQMSELENCIRTFDRIDTRHGNRNEKAMYDFEKLCGTEKPINRKKREERDR